MGIKIKNPTSEGYEGESSRKDGRKEGRRKKEEE